jgi:hypothetical protein
MSLPATKHQPRTAGVRHVRGASRHRQYLASGDAAAFVDLISPVRGWRRTADAVAVRFGMQFGRRHATGDTAEDWQELCAVVGEPVTALLLDTAYYKSTTFVGPFQVVDGSRVFVKVFRSADDAATEVERASAFAMRCSPEFRPARLLRPAGRVVLYELLERSGPVPAQLLDDASSAWCRRMLDHPEAPESLFVPPAELAAMAGEASLPLVDCTEGLRRCPPMPAVLAHGDLTPWNAFVDDHDEICLVDYERVGRSTPFADYFHFAIQPEALHGRHLSIGSLVDKAAHRGDVDLATARAWLAAYLVTELAWDLRAYVVEGRRHAQLWRLISTKSTMLRRVFDD